MPSPPPDSPAFDPDLEALLAESLANQATAKRIAKAREDLTRRGGRAQADVEADKALVAAWEFRHDWKPILGIALFERHTCLHCASGVMIFRQLMLQQQHRRLANTTRWVQVDSLPEETELPREIQVEDWESGFCAECSQDFGFDFKALRVGRWILGAGAGGDEVADAGEVDAADAEADPADADDELDSDPAEGEPDSDSTPE